MTTVAVLADPPADGFVLTDFVDAGPLSEREAASLYESMVADVSEAVVRSGGELLVNYRPADHLPDGVDDPEERLRVLLDEELDDATDGRYEVQVGSDFAARAGNTVTHLLEREGVTSAAIVTPESALLRRKHVDSAAMKLRGSDVVLGPSIDGRVYYAGFGATVDFADAFDPPAIETLVSRSLDGGRSVDFLPVLPSLERPADVETVGPILAAQSDAGRQVPPRTSAKMRELGLIPGGDQ